MRLPAEDAAAARPVHYLGFVDALRGLAVLGVLLVHSADYVNLTGRAWDWTRLGAAGVQLFYITSAFTLCLSQHGRSGEAHPTQNFFLRRFFRIAPAFYLAMLLNFLMLLRWPQEMTPFPHAVDFALGIFFLHGVKMGAINSVTGGSWSVADETIFYAMLPWLYRRLRGLWTTVGVYVVSAAILGPLSLWLATLYPQHGFFNTYWFPREFPIFVSGIVVFLLWKRFGLARPGTVAHARPLSLLLLVFAGLVLHPGLDLYLWGLGMMALVLALALHPWGLLVNRATRFLGKISYSVYLFHFYVLHAVNLGLHTLDARTHGWWYRHYYGRVSGFAIHLAVMLCLTVPVGTLSWKYLEQPFIGLGRRIIARRAGAASAAALVPATGDLLRDSNTADNQF